MFNDWAKFGLNSGEICMPCNYNLLDFEIDIEMSLLRVGVEVEYEYHIRKVECVWVILL